ncbi:hypothetical protein ACJX0J_018996, partial [Zea mays]
STPVSIILEDKNNNNINKALLGRFRRFEGNILGRMREIGRSIHDNYMMLDITKAFDSLRRGFLWKERKEDIAPEVAAKASGWNRLHKDKKKGFNGAIILGAWES